MDDNNISRYPAARKAPSPLEPFEMGQASPPLKATGSCPVTAILARVEAMSTALSCGANFMNSPLTPCKSGALPDFECARDVTSSGT
eukprot:3457414-Karenia_brevis.AAC.1